MVFKKFTELSSELKRELTKIKELGDSGEHRVAQINFLLDFIELLEKAKKSDEDKAPVLIGCMKIFLEDIKHSLYSFQKSRVRDLLIRMLPDFAEITPSDKAILIKQIKSFLLDCLKIKASTLDSTKRFKEYSEDDLYDIYKRAKTQIMIAGPKPKRIKNEEVDAEENASHSAVPS